MAKNSTVSVTRHISATPDTVWAMVTDLPRMGEWSPENRGGEWVAPAIGPAVGASFKGRNENGKKSWGTQVKVNVCDAPRKFSFGLMVGGRNWCDWVYEIEPAESGCTVTHRWVDHRGSIAGFLGKLVSGVADRGVHNLKNMEVTMDNLTKAAEASAV